MSKNIKILVVDDEPMNRVVMTELLGEAFDVECVEDSQSCLEALDYLDKWSPDLILMDVKMPGMNGLEICKIIKSRPDTEFIPVIFVSALDSPEERMEGYEAGGDDYIAKPYNDKELLKKIHLSISNSEKLKASQSNFQESMQAAMAAMTSTAEMGDILHFYQNSFSINTYSDVIKSLMSVLTSYGLHSTVSVFVNDDVISESNTGAVRQLEISVIKQLRDRNTSIFNFGSRSSYSYSNITILILNMPLDDEEKCGRLRDHIAMLAEGGNARIASLITEGQKNKQQGSLKELVVSTSAALQTLEQQQSVNQDELKKIMSQLSNDVEASFISLGLSEEQEDTLMDIVKKADHQAKALFEKDSILRENLDGIMMSLKNI